MLSEDGDNTMNVNEILTVFFQYGFKKASMEDLARAADLSRQSLYKKFGSKEAIFDWVMTEAMSAAYEAATNALQDESHEGSERLANAFQRWTGDHIDILRSTRHGGEILEKSMELHARNGKKGEDEFYGAIEALLLREGYATDDKMAEDKAFALTMASKGLMFKAENSTHFAQSMQRVIRALTEK